MKYICFLSLLFLAPPLGYTDTIHVPGDFTTIQEALDAAKNGDAVLVSPGTYHESVLFPDKNVILSSIQGADVTVIDGDSQGSTVTFEYGAGSGAVLQGFTITNGTGTWKPLTPPPFGIYLGGGIYIQENASPIIKENTICKNTAMGDGYYSEGLGGGVYCESNTSPTLSSNKIEENISDGGGGIGCSGDFISLIITHNTISKNICGTGWGGGIHCDGVSISGNISKNKITDNKATQGGGIFSNSDIIIEDNIIAGNSAQDDNFGGGGGISVHEDEQILNNLIMGNSATRYGGGIACTGYSATVVVMSNMIRDNTVSGHNYALGGGVHLQGVTNPWISNNFIFKNSVHGDYNGSGGGIYNTGSSIFVTNNTLVGNVASGVVESFGGGICSKNNSVQMTNLICWDNQAASGAEAAINESGHLYVDYCDIKGGKASVFVGSNCSLIWNMGNIDAYPEFVSPGGEDFHLKYTSPCRNKGTGSGFFLPDYDFENDPRDAGGTIDMGADEFHTHLYFTGDAVPGGNITVKIIGQPAASPVGLWLAAGIMDPPLNSPWGLWYLAFPVVGPINLGVIPSEGVTTLAGALPASMPVPITFFLQALVGKELTNLLVIEVE